MMDVVQALELFEMCADEIDAEETRGDGDVSDPGRRRLTLTARALAKSQLDVAQLTRFPLRASLGDGTPAREPALTLGAMIVFRTADRCVRARASTGRTLDALHRAVEQYLEIIPGPLQNEVDKRAVRALIAEPDRSLPPGRRPRCATMAGRFSPASGSVTRGR
jgi:hypothetical protein